jgi:hypothetical protein
LPARGVKPLITIRFPELPPLDGCCVAKQLTRAYGASSLAIGLLQVNAEDTSPELYAVGFQARLLPFDFVWFTPRANDVDHCAELRASTDAVTEDACSARKAVWWISSRPWGSEQLSAAWT